MVPKCLVSISRAPSSAPMDVVPCRVSYDVHGHQCSQSSCCLHCYPSAADTHPVVDPVNGAESEAESAQAALVYPLCY